MICFLSIFLFFQIQGSLSTIGLKNLSPAPKKYYLDLSGNNSNIGTLNAPFTKLSFLDSIDFQPGDSIFLKGRQVFEGLLDLELSGNFHHPIVITSYGEGRAIINGNEKEACILSGSWYHIKNINFKGSGRKTGNTGCGLVIRQSSNVLVENVKIWGFQKSGLLVDKSDHVNAKKIHALQNGSIGISVSKSDNCVIKDCLAENNPGDPTNLTNHSGNGILVGWSKNILIDHCVATNNGWDMPRIGNGPVGIWAYQTDSIIIQSCIAYRNKTSAGAKDGGGFDFDGGVTNSVIQYCLSYENDGAGYGLFQYPGADHWSNNIIRYNLSINDGIDTEGAGGIFIWNGGFSAEELSDCFIHNNVVINEHKPAVVFEQSSSNINFNFNNNIFIGSGNLVEGPSSGDKFINNVWWKIHNERITFRDYKDLQTWADATGQEMLNNAIVGMQIDPLLTMSYNTNFTDPYKLNSLIGFKLNDNSPVIDKGIDLNEVINLSYPKSDFFGNPIVPGKLHEPGIHELPE